MSNTKNIKGNRKAVYAEYIIGRWFKIPDGLDLEDKTVVQFWIVHYGHLEIFYTDGREEIIEMEDNAFDYKRPKETSIEDAEDNGIYYTADEGSDEEED